MGQILSLLAPKPTSMKDAALQSALTGNTSVLKNAAKAKVMNGLTAKSPLLGFAASSFMAKKANTAAAPAAPAAPATAAAASPALPAAPAAPAVATKGLAALGSLFKKKGGRRSTRSRKASTRKLRR